MEITLKGNPNEIAALVLAVQERQKGICPEMEREQIAKSVVKSLNNARQKSGTRVLLI